MHDIPPMAKSHRLGWRPVLTGLAVVLCAAAVFLAYTHERSGSWLAAPLDDSFIHFQYAKQLARGRVLQYNDGDSRSTGATSLLYLLVLAPGWLVGFRGIHLVIWSWLANGALHLLGGLALFVSVQRLTRSRALAYTGLAAFLACGPMLWGAYSHMEIALFSTLLLLALAAAIRHEQDGHPQPARQLLVWGSLLALVRPEGMLLAGGLSLWLLWRHLGQPAGGQRGLARLWSGRRALWPVGTAVAVMLLLLVLTGRVSTNASIKSHLSRLGDDPVRYLETTVSWLPMTLQILLEKWPAYLAPLTALLLLGGLALWAGQSSWRRPGAGVLVLGWLLLLTLFYSLLVARRDHFDRYYLPYFGLSVVAAWCALGELRRRLPAAAWGAPLLSSALLLFMLPETLFWAQRYGDNCRDLVQQHFLAATWLRENTPPGVRIAVNDAGAIPYLSERYTYDIVGLTHNAFYQRKTHMPHNGPVWEALERLPHRPELVVAYPEWIPELAGLPVFSSVKRFTLLRRTMVANETKFVWKMRWDLLADPHQLPAALLQGRKVQDRIDIADLDSERQHSYRRLDEGAPQGALGTERQNALTLVDAGRVVSKGEAFRLRAVPGRPGVLVLRTSGPGPLEVDLSVQGRPLGRWNAMRAPGLATVTRELTADQISGATLEIEARAHKSYSSFQYWLLQ